MLTAPNKIIFNTILALIPIKAIKLNNEYILIIVIQFNFIFTCLLTNIYLDNTIIKDPTTCAIRTAYIPNKSIKIYSYGR